MKFWHVIPLLLIMFGVQILGTYLAVPSVTNNVSAFGDPQNIASPFWYLLLMLVFTGALLLMYRYGLGKFVKVFFYVAVWATMFFVASTIDMQITNGNDPIVDGAALLIPILCALLVWQYPEWYVLDIIGFVMCAGAAAIFGSSFGILPVILLLVVFAIYDAIAVYKTRHMIALAENVLTDKLPALFIIPESRSYSYLEEHTWSDLDNVEKRQTHILGMGDIVIPSAMVVSASMFISTSFKIFGIFTLPALGAMVGSLIGLIALEWYAGRNPRSHAGLPILNSCTILGFLLMFGVSAFLGL